MKRSYIFFAVTALLMLSACNDLLEVKPQSSITEQVYFQNQEDFDPYVRGIYTYMRTFSNEIVYGTDRSEELIPAGNARFSTAWNHILSPTTGAIDYTKWYEAIGHCNLLLDKIEDFPFSDDAPKNRIKAEAYSLRAYFFFNLTRIIGDAPLMLQTVRSENVPLLPRSPARDVLNQIFADLDAAIALFPDDSFANGKYRFSYPAAHALRAEAKLWSAKVLGGGETDFNDAIESAVEVENAGLSLLENFREITTVRSNEEIILAAYYDRNESGGSSNYAKNALPPEDMIRAAANKDDIPHCLTSINGQGAYQISAQSRALFSENANDKRTAATYVETQGLTPEVAWIGKYPGNVYPDDRVPDNDLVIFRLADVYLMLAEAYAGLNDMTTAVEYLDKVRLRAGTGNYTGPTDKPTVELEILNERGRELFYENKRWYDLVRFHHGGTIDVYNYVPNLIGKNTPLYWPLAAKVLATNSLIKQTDGYESVN